MGLIGGSCLFQNQGNYLHEIVKLCNFLFQITINYDSLMCLITTNYFQFFIVCKFTPYTFWFTYDYIMVIRAAF